MKIYTINFETLVKVYSPYIDAVKSLEGEKKTHLAKMDVYKSEMQSIIDSSQTLILDEKTKKEKMEKFGNLQNEASKQDGEFRRILSKKQDEILKRIYLSITEMVTDFSTANNIDMVINNSEVIYFSSNMDITDKIIAIIKEKNLYTDELINQKESV